MSPLWAGSLDPGGPADVHCGSGSWGGGCLSLAAYVPRMGPTLRAAARADLAHLRVHRTRVDAGIRAARAEPRIEIAGGFGDELLPAGGIPEPVRRSPVLRPADPPLARLHRQPTTPGLH